MSKALLLTLPLMFIGCNCETKTIAELGACNYSGRCRVRYTDDTVGFQTNWPVAGQNVGVCGGE